ncbi:MAG: recombinase family protein, partial [Ruthenibacterium sp.]
MNDKNITVIPAKASDFRQGLPNLMKKKRVAGYARVSTDKDEQQNSYEAQVSYYTDYIQRNPEWEFVEVYTDEGISGTSTKHREGFKRMLSDALDGKIDLILTKSVSRFARNTVDSLTTIRQLKEKGVEVYFEKENIFTLDSKGELLLTIMASLAQEESRSISKNIIWGKRKSMADGKVSFAYSSFLGYDMGSDGHLFIVEEQAKIVHRIYDEFLAGKTTCNIATTLTEDGIPSPMNKSRWQESTVRHILQNVKYRGDSVLQSTFVEDFLTKKVKKNNGELPQYYVSKNH